MFCLEFFKVFLVFNNFLFLVNEIGFLFFLDNFLRELFLFIIVILVLVFFFIIVDIVFFLNGCV